MIDTFCNLPSLGVSIALRFAGEEERERLIGLVAGAGAGIRLPPYEFAERSDLDEVAELEVHTQFSADQVELAFEGALSMPAVVDEETGIHWDFWKAVIAVLSVCLLNREIVIFHAAAIETTGSVTLLPGASGAGKSSLAYAARMQGHRVYASELAFIRRGLLLAGNATLGIDQPALEAFDLPALPQVTHRGGRLLVPNDSIGSGQEVRAVAFPRVTTASPTSRVISGRRARMLLYENAVGQLPFAQLVDQQRRPLSLPVPVEALEILASESERLAARGAVILEGAPERLIAGLASTSYEA